MIRYIELQSKIFSKSLFLMKKKIFITTAKEIINNVFSNRIQYLYNFQKAEYEKRYFVISYNEINHKVIIQKVVYL